VTGSDGVAASVDQQDDARQIGGRLEPVRNRTAVWGLLAGLVPFAVAFAVYLFVFLEIRPSVTGDEPHYLLTAESIAYDLDVDLRNDYASEDRLTKILDRAFFPLEPHAAVYKRSGELRPIRGVGLPTVLAPAIGVGGLTGARLVMVLIAALLADQLYRLLRDLRFRRRYRVAAWAATVFCLPVVLFTSQVYPELAGALLIVTALRVMIVGASNPAALVLGSTAAAALVWLHVRYLPLAVFTLVGLVLAACLQGWRPEIKGPAIKRTVRAAGAIVVRCAGALVQGWRTITLPTLAPFGVVFGLLLLAYDRWYGSPDLHASYTAYGGPEVGTGHWDFWYQYALRDILDPVVGWIPFAPVHWLGFAGLGAVVVTFGWPAAGCIAAAAGYELLISSVGTGVGFGLPARYPMIVVPLIAVPLAVVIQKIRVARLVFVPLLAVSLIFAVAAARNFGGLYPSDIQRIVGMRSTAPAFPELEATVQAPVSFTLPPDAPPAPETGKLEGAEVIGRMRRDKPGFLRFGPYVGLKPGAYLATFSLAAAGVGPEEPVAILQILSGSTVLASKVLTGRQLPPLRDRNDIDLSFATPGGYVETRVYYRGRGTLRAGPISVQPIAVPQPVTHFRDWPLAFLWVGGTVLVGWLFVQVITLNRQRVRSSETSSEHSAGSGSPS
jgi:hypothetical protein